MTKGLCDRPTYRSDEAPDAAFLDRLALHVGQSTLAVVMDAVQKTARKWHYAYARIGSEGRAGAKGQNQLYAMRFSLCLYLLVLPANFGRGAFAPVCDERGNWQTVMQAARDLGMPETYVSIILLCVNVCGNVPSISDASTLF